jgi:hypothetical protein
VENYFNYFTEIEQHFQQRRGNLLLLSTLDWALIESWKDAGLPLEAVLRGIDATFDKYDRRPSKTRKINSLAYCSQEVLAAAEQMKEAATGSTRPPRSTGESGLEQERVACFLERNAKTFASAVVPEAAAGLVADYSRKLLAMADQLRAHIAAPAAQASQEQAVEPRSATGPASAPAKAAAISLEELERRLTVMEEKLFATLLAGSPDDLLVGIRAGAERELAPYRSKMAATQIEQLLKQCTNRRLLEHYALARLSLFYM